MKLNAVGVTSKDFKKSVEFYNILGFEFPKFKDDEKHIESIDKQSGVKLMLDEHDFATELIGEEPKPSNHSTFAVQYESAAEVNDIEEKLRTAKFKIKTEPWDAFWGQRYCVAIDPDGYCIDLYAQL